MLGLFGLHVVVKGTFSLLLLVLCSLKSSRGISLAFSMLAYISDARYFCSIFLFSTIVHVLLARENGIFFTTGCYF